jgi:hypothetical protein
MADQSNELPASRVVRWAAIGVLIGVAVALYFVAGTRVAPITSAPGSTADSTR